MEPFVLGTVIYPVNTPNLPPDRWTWGSDVVRSLPTGTAIRVATPGCVFVFAVKDPTGQWIAGELARDVERLQCVLHYLPPAGAAPVLAQVEPWAHPSEAGLPGGLSPDTLPNRSPAEDAVRTALVDCARNECQRLLATVTPANAARVLAQVTKVAEGLRSLLPAFGQADLPEELEGMDMRTRRARLMGIDRETGGVNALRELTAEWRRSERPKRLRELLGSIELLEKRQGLAADAEADAAKRTADAAVLEGLRKRADETAAAILADSVERDTRTLARQLGETLTGASPDGFEEVMAGEFGQIPGAEAMLGALGLG